MACKFISPVSFFSETDEVKFVDNDTCIACTAVKNDEALEEQSVEVLPEEWNLEPDEFLLVTQYCQKYFTSSAWLLVEKGVSSLKQQPRQGIYLFMSYSFVIFFSGEGSKSGNKCIFKSLIELSFNSLFISF